MQIYINPGSETNNWETRTIKFNIADAFANIRELVHWCCWADRHEHLWSSFSTKMILHENKILPWDFINN